ncbi:MAG: trimethylamine methyltransferase family protein, partial [Candidatus Thorarchaeota archaeon]
SDSKIEDAQSGSESALGIILGALARINIISGPGMLAYLNCQSLEKLAIDNELCGSAYRLIRGLDLEDLEVVADLLSTVGPSGNYLGQKHTSKRFRDEHFMPSEIICRLTADSWLESGSKSMFDRASERVDQILKDHTPEAPDNLKELEKVYIQLRKERT